MDLGNAVRVLLRRWLVVLIGIVLTVGAAGYIYATTPPSYSAGARMLLLLPPNARGPDAVGSPFLYLPDGLNVIARLTVGTTTERPFREAMAEEGLRSQITATVDPQSPTIVVVVEGLDPANVIATRDWAVERIQDNLLELQQAEGSPPSQIAHARVFGAEEVPIRDGSTWTRSVLAVVAAGGVVTLVAAFLVEYLMNRRRSRSAAEPLDDPGTNGDDDVEPADASRPEGEGRSEDADAADAPESDDDREAELATAAAS